MSETMRKATNELSKEVFENLSLINHSSLVGYLMQDKTILLAFGTPPTEDGKTNYIGLKLSIEQGEYMKSLITKMIDEVPIMEQKLGKQPKNENVSSTVNSTGSEINISTK